MWEKIKAFFSNKVVKVVSWIILALDVLSLVLGGATEAEISSGLTLIMGVIGAISAFIVFICERQKK